MDIVRKYSVRSVVEVSSVKIFVCCDWNGECVQDLIASY